MYKDENIIKVATDVDHDVEFVAEIGYIASRVRYLEQTFLDYFDSYPDTDIGEFLYIDQDHDILEDKLQQVHKQLEINQKQQPLNNIKDIDWFNVGGLGNIEENVYNRQYKEENQQNKNSILKSSTPSTLDDSTLLCSAKNRQNLLQDLLIKFYEEYDKIKTVTNKFARKETTLQRKTSIIMNISSEDKLPEKFCSCNTSSSSCNGNQFLQQQQQHKDISLINQQSTISTTETTGTSSSTTARSDGGDDKNLISEIHICNNCNNKLNVGNKDSNIRNIHGEKGEQQKEFQQGCNEYGAVCDINSTKTYCIIGDGGNLNKIKNDDLINDVKSRKIIDKCSSCGDSILNENVFKMHGIGISEYSLLEFKNTIKNCHFNDDDLRAIIKDLKRKIEYTEKMNWLCLSKCPMGPPHRKSSLPKHTEVKKRFLEICDNNLSDEVKAALRLPAFDSYDWEDADVIHLMQTMFTELGLVDKFNIPKSTLREWLYEVYKHYNQVPFHNFRHCFCVAQMMYAIARQANLIARLGELEVLILLVSCICHDLDHPGYNNIYQINARTELALRYNDISPLENHHCSIAFRLLEHPDCNIFKNFSRETFNVIREGIIRCILATDMARHNEILTQFKDVVSTFDYTNRSHINLLCMILIKVADISNEARPMDVAEPWLDRLLTEFFAQSAAEKSEGLPVTPFMDPDKVSKPGSQVRFIGLVLLPLFEALGDLLPELTELIIIPVRVALDYYKRLNDAQSKARKSLVENIENNPDGGGGGGSSGSPQLPRSQSGISVRSRRSIPSQKSTSRTSVDEPICIAAELHDLPEGSESGDSETATEVDVAEKASKFKVDTEGSSNRSKSSHSTSRKSSREKRPSMISEMCSSGGRIRNSYGNIHGYHSSRCQFGTNRAVSLDQYSCNNRRLSDGLQQVISDSNVFYNRRNCSLDNTDVVVNNLIDLHIKKPKINENISSVNANVSTAATVAVAAAAASFGVVVGEDLLNMNISNSYITMQQQQQQQQSQQQLYIKNEGNNSGNGNDEGENGGGNCSSQNSGTIQQQQQKQTTWKARFKQITDIFTFNFDRTNKRYGNNSGIVGGGPTSTKSSPCSIRNNNSTTATRQNDNMLQQHLYKSKTSGICCTITNNLSPNLKHKQQLEFINTGGRNRAYSLDVPARNRYSSSSGGGDSSRKSSKNEDNSNNKCDYLNEDNNSNHTSIGEGLSAPPPQIRIGSNDQQSPIITTPPMTDIVNTGDVGCNMDLGNEHCYGRSSSSSSCGIAVAQTSSSGRPTI